MGWVTTLLLGLILASGVFVLLPTPPSLADAAAKAKARGTALDVPGPIVAGAVSNLSLDGLTVIPLVKLPPIKLSFRLPLLPHHRLRIGITTTASEVVFHRLKITSANYRAADAGRQAMHVHVEGVDADFRGSFGVKVHLQWQDQRRKAVTPAGASDGENNKLDKLEGRQYRWQGSGRVDAKIDGSAMDLELQFVKGRNARRASAAAASPTTATEAKEARLEVLSSAFNEGDIQRAHIQGFGPWGSLGTKLLPWVRGTIFVRWPVKVVGDFLVREMVEGGVLDDILKTAWEQGGQHVDVSTYSNILDTDREAEIKTPLDAASLSPPTPSPAATTPVNPPSTATAPSAASTPFRLHTHLIGPTRLHSFALPDFQPPLYRPGGTRAALQSFNLLTSELQLKFYESAFSSITFDRASLAFDPASANGSTTGGDLVVTVQELVVVLSSKFKLVADTSAVVAWTTGLKRLGEKGASTTKVEARSLQIRFGLHHVDAATRKKRNMATGGFPYELRESVMSPFTSIEPRFEMDSSFLKLGTELVNVITAGLKTQIAQAASFVVKRGMQDVVRSNLQAALDGLEEKLREAGIELPSTFRAHSDEAVNVELD